MTDPHEPPPGGGGGATADDRRDFFYRAGTFLLGGLMTLVLAVPGAAYVLSPLRRKSKTGDFQSLTSLGQLKEGVPQLFPVIGERQDAWVKYPEEPVGAVWLMKQPAGSNEPVIAYSAECPHMGCAVDLAADGRTFQCPCHKSSFTLEGKPTNQVPPRGMDRLGVRIAGDDVQVKFQRFRLGSQEKAHLA